MSVICFSALKGGVGKTSLSLNIAHAFASSECQVLIIDLDPAAHSSRFFDQDNSLQQSSTLAKLFLTDNKAALRIAEKSVIDAAISLEIPLIQGVRKNLDMIRGGAELRHFLWGRGARTFKSFFSRLVKELKSEYDYIIIDTPPDFNVLMRNAIAASNLAVVPVDSSAMSIHCLEEIINSAAHIKGPNWAIVRSMVNRSASRVQAMSHDKLTENLRKVVPEGEEDISDDEKFFSVLKRNTNSQVDPALNSDSPIYLLNSVIYRTEQQNKLSFLNKTAFDSKAPEKLAKQYLKLAKEIEYILEEFVSEGPAVESLNSYFEENNSKESTVPVA